MQHLAPKAQPDAKETLREEWISNILRSGAWRAKWRSMPLLWMLVIGVFVFPMGLWSSLETAGQADEISVSTTPEVTPGEVQEKPAESHEDPVGALPEAPASSTTEATTAPAISSNRDKFRVTVIVGGQTRTGAVSQSAKTVREAVEALNLKINPLDRVQPAASARAFNGMKIRITRIRNEVKTSVLTIEPDVRYQPTSTMRPGTTRQIQSGRKGRIEVSQRIWFKDGKVSMRQDLGRKMVQEEQDTIIAVGTYAAYMPGRIPYHNRYATAYVNASRSGSPRDRMQSHETKTLRRVRSVILTATGYSPDPRENGGWTRTATGMPIAYGAAAVDPRVIPLGTKLYVEGYGYAFACDTGGAIRGNRIDLAYNSYYEANTKGRKKVKVWILAP